MEKKDKTPNEQMQQLITWVQLENGIDSLSFKLRDGVTGIGEIPDWRKHNKYLNLLDEAIAEAQSLRHSLELTRPMIIMTEDLPHICDDCPVTLNNLDANEHCAGCISEQELQSYVPKDLRYLDPDEVSVEEDGPVQSRLEERINYEPKKEQV